MLHDAPHLLKTGVRVLMLIDRGVGNSNKGSKRWVGKRISTSPLEFDMQRDILLEQMTYLNQPGLRLYSSLNDRNMDKAILLFQHKQLDLIEQQKENFYSRLNDNFVSCLMKPLCKNDNNFLLDVDDKNSSEAFAFCEQHNIIVRYHYKSVKGWHLITMPFNTAWAEDAETFEVKKDALILLAANEGEA